jgi:hypothetical protein
MANFTVSPVLIAAGAERRSAAVDPPARLTKAFVQLTDGGAWDTTAGFVKRWGVQASDAAGANFSFANAGSVFQGDPADSTTWLPFGSRDRAGGMPALNMERSDQNGNPLPLAEPGVKLRLAIEVTVNITLGASITTG